MSKVLELKGLRRLTIVILAKDLPARDIQEIRYDPAATIKV